MEVANEVLETGGVSPPRKFKPSHYLFVVGLAVYCAVVWYFGWQKVRDQLLSADLPMVALAAAIFTTATWCRALKWRYALGGGHHALGLFFISKATGNWSPGRIGEFAPMALRRHRTPKIGAWIMLDRAIEIVATLALGLFGLAAIDLLTRTQYLLVAGLTVTVSVAAMVLLTRPYTRPGVPAFFLWLAKLLADGSIMHRTAVLFAAISEELYLYVPKLPVAVAITVATKAADLFAVMLIFASIGHRVSFALTAAAKCALAIVSFIPITPAATGVPHGAQAWMMNEVAGIPPEALLVGIGIEVVLLGMTFWSSFGLVSPQIKGAAS